MLGGEGAQRGEVGLGRRRHHTQHQRHGLGRGHFDLRQLGADAQAGDQAAQRPQPFANARIEYHAGLKRGQKRAFALAETDQYRVALADVLGAKSRAAPVAPDRSSQWLGNLHRRHLADPGQRFDQLLVLVANLGLGRQMLQGAAAADPKMRAARRHPIRRGPVDGHGLAFIDIARHADIAEAHLLARQGIGDEHDLAVEPRNAAAVLGQVDDIGDELAGREWFATVTRHQ